jgi:hypothetical protein
LLLPLKNPPRLLYIQFKSSSWKCLSSFFLAIWINSFHAIIRNLSQISSIVVVRTIPLPQLHFFVSVSYCWAFQSFRASECSAWHRAKGSEDLKRLFIFENSCCSGRNHRERIPKAPRNVPKDWLGWHGVRQSIYLYMGKILHENGNKISTN